MTLILRRVIKEEDKRILHVKELVQNIRGRVRLGSNTYIYIYIYIYIHIDIYKYDQAHIYHMKVKVSVTQSCPTLPSLGL